MRRALASPLFASGEGLAYSKLFVKIQVVGFRRTLSAGVPAGGDTADCTVFSHTSGSQPHLRGYDGINWPPKDK